MPDDEVSSLERLIELFQRCGVEFVLIGGQAECLMGSPRVTYDTDVCYRRTKANLARLAEALRELRPALRDAPPDLPFVLDERSLALGSNFTFRTSLGDLDLIAWVEPVGDYESLLGRTEEFVLGDRSVRVIGLEDLIRVKRHVGRPKDQQSLLQLLAIQEQRRAQEDRRQSDR